MIAVKIDGVGIFIRGLVAVQVVYDESLSENVLLFSG